MSGFLMKTHCTYNSYSQATCEGHLKIFINAQNKSQQSDKQDLFPSLDHSGTISRLVFPTLWGMLWWAVSHKQSLCGQAAGSHSLIKAQWTVSVCILVCLYGNLGWYLSRRIMQKYSILQQLSDFRILSFEKIRFVIPLSKPLINLITWFLSESAWNSYATTSQVNASVAEIAVLSLTRLFSISFVVWSH